MLEIKKLNKQFGGLAAVNGLDLIINNGETVGLIGPNGAGKTTVFNLITGFLKPSSGQIILDKADVTGSKPHSIAKKGLVRTFQETSIFPDYTVKQNIMAACYIKPKFGFWESLLHTPSGHNKDEQISTIAFKIIQFVGLEEYMETAAGNLAHGHKRTLGIAIALAADPKILLLDEPLAGMNAGEIDEAMALINKIRDKGTSIILIEHNMRAAMSLCQKIAVLNFGNKIAEGSPDEVSKNQDVIQAYLGMNEGVTDQSTKASKKDDAIFLNNLAKAYPKREQTGPEVSLRPGVKIDSERSEETTNTPFLDSNDIQLSLKDVTVKYGTAEAIHNVSIGMGKHSVVSIIGSNGAGKSTILKAITGLVPFASGEIKFQNNNLKGLSADKIVRLGISYVPEGRRPFPYMSVMANLKMGAFLRKNNSEINRDLEKIFERFPILKKRYNQLGASLSGGEQEMLVISRALMSKPKLLLMDEPTLGLAPLVIEELGNLIKDISKSGIEILLVEQNVGLVTKVSDLCYVLEVGKIILTGQIDDLINDDHVRKAFLGK